MKLHRRKRRAPFPGPQQPLRIMALCTVLSLAALAQNRPDFSGIWILDREHSGPETVSWASARPSRFTIRQAVRGISIDTGDGSLFGMVTAPTQEPLVWPLDGTSKTVIDHSLGDLLNFIRKIRTEAKWDGRKLVALTTHLSETDGKESGGITRVFVFELLGDQHRMIVERTGYRHNAPSKLIPLIMHHGRLEDDLMYATDKATYLKSPE